MPIELGSFSLGSVAGTIVGGIAGHYLTKVRDKEARDIKDFNTAAEVLAGVLILERRGPMPTCNIDFSIFRRVLIGKELIDFDKCVEEYHRSISQAKIIYANDGGDLMRVGASWYQDANPIITEIDKLLEFTKRK
jgi:hypothetical protein